MEKYILKHPITYGSDKIESIELKRPKGRHLAEMPADAKIWDFIKIAAKASGVSITVFEEMDAEDVLAIGGLLGKTLVGSQVTGS